MARNFVSRVANKVISESPAYTFTITVVRSRPIAPMSSRMCNPVDARFIPIYASWMGAKVVDIPVHHAPRLHASELRLNRVAKVILDLIVVKFLDQYMVKPIYVFGGFGILSCCLRV